MKRGIPKRGDILHLDLEPGLDFKKRNANVIETANLSVEKVQFFK